MPIHLEIVTAERVVLSDEVDQINAPARLGAWASCRATSRC